MKRPLARTIPLLSRPAHSACRLPEATASAGAAPATVQVTLGQGARPIPDSFLGVSVEPDELLSFERRPAFGRLLEQLAAPGGGRLVLRVGGRSADDAYWPTPGIHPPPGAYTLSPRWLAGLASLVSAAKLRVMLNLNLAANSPQMGGQFAAAATQALPAGDIAAVEIGNEPDLYGYGPHAPLPGYKPANYVRQYANTPAHSLPAACRRCSPARL